MSCDRCNRRQALKTGVQLAASLAVTSGLSGVLSACGGTQSSTSSTSNPGTSVPNNASNQYLFDFTTYPALQSVGGSVVATVAATSGSTTVSVVRTGSGSASTVSVFCTHQGCQLNSYDSSSQLYSCPCHGAQFSSSGSVMAGPASSNLTSYSSAVTGSGIQVTIA